MNIFLLIVALHFIIGLIVAVMYFVKGWIKVEDDIMDDIQRIAYRQKIHKDQTDEWMEDKIKQMKRDDQFKYSLLTGLIWEFGLFFVIATYIGSGIYQVCAFLMKGLRGFFEYMDTLVNKGNKV